MSYPNPMEGAAEFLQTAARMMSMSGGYAGERGTRGRARAERSERYEPNGKREVERRQRQLASGFLKTN